MKKVNPRRFEFSEIQTASMWMAGNREIAFPREPMKTWLPWILCGAMMLVWLGLCGVLALEADWTKFVLLFMPTCTFVYKIEKWAWKRYFWHKAVKAANRRCQENPDGAYAYTYWIEGDFFYAERWKSKRCVRLSSFQRMTCRKGLVMLTTGRKWEPAYVFSRNKLSDDQWREFCSLIQAANPKFKHPFQ